ncbi:MAG: ABC transporter, partial [Acidimicrobiia bacterium]|nr:ABC transporter [Acidimicrobiia bacterium]
MPSAVESLVTLHDRLLAVDLPLELGGVDDARRTRAELVDQIEDYLLPRLRSIDAPLLAVIGGSTGAGKSTITNTLVGAEVSRAGVLRPTTRAPVLVCNPADRDWFDRGGVLADLARLSGEPPPGTSGLQLVESPAVPVGLGLLDSPDIDSVETAHHDLAAQLLGAADLWLFVTTAARYADAVPWAYLARAQERATALAVVVNRIPPGGADEIMPHLRSMLAEHGLGGALTFAVTEVPLVDGRIPGGVEPVRAWLDALVADASAREAMIRSTLDGALASLVGRVERTAVAVDAHAASADALGALMERRYDEALHEVAGELDGGNLLHSEVLDRWQDHVGTGEWMARVQSGIGRLRNRLRSMVTGRAAPEAEVRGEVQASLAMLVREAADRAALDVVSGWTALPGGRQVLDGGERGLDRATPLLAGRVEREIE